MPAQNIADICSHEVCWIARRDVGDGLSVERWGGTALHGVFLRLG